MCLLDTFKFVDVWIFNEVQSYLYLNLYICIYLYKTVTTVVQKQLLMEEALSSAQPKTSICMLGCHFIRVRALSLLFMKVFMKVVFWIDFLTAVDERNSQEQLCQ